MKTPKNFKYLSLIMAASLIMTGNNVAADANEIISQSSDTQELNVISRVIDSNNNGLLKYSYVDENGDAYQLDTSSDSNETNLRKAASLPSKYDLRDEQLTTSVKDQGVTGACWAFAAIKSIESSSILNNITNINNTDFSENHLAWYSYHGTTDTSNTTYGDKISLVSGGSVQPLLPIFGNNTTHDTFAYDIGGNVLTAISTLAGWSGAETEENAPFTANTYAEEYEMADDMTSKGESLRYNSVAHLQNAYCYDNSSRSQIKQAVIDYGAIDISMFYDECGFETKSLNGKSFYQTKYSGLMAQKMANHCVTIVGWDDNYSKSNFANKPSSDGAWLIANSYGSEYNDNGYFWLSYQEPSICDVYALNVEPTSNYDNNYQYDGNGYNDSVYIKDTKIQGANIFTADKNSTQELKAVSFYTITDGQPYTIKIYKNVSGSSPTNGTLVSECTTSGTAKLSGYHTVPLSSGCTIDAGEKFSVVITYKYKASTGNQAYLPVEGSSFSYSSIKYNYSSKKGQSFYYLNKKWHDASADGYNNICIKAFTDNIDTDSTEPNVTTAPAATDTPVPSLAPSVTGTPSPSDGPATTITVNKPSVKLSKNSVTLGKKESYKINASITGGSGITKDNLRYTSSKNSIAVVDSDGIITAKSTGTAVITVTADRVQSATITVNVKKAPSKIKLTPSSKKTLKKGDTFTISAKVPSGSASYHIKYTSSNKKIAKVNSKGKVTAIKNGTCVITAKTYNNKKATIKVAVK